MKRIKIIVVDDHQLFLDGMLFALSQMKEVETKATFIDPIVALDYIINNEIDLLITDISMPSMNGLEFIQKAKKSNKNIKILVISMFPSLHDIPDINGYLLKEAGHEELHTAINQIIFDRRNYFYKDYSNRDKQHLEFEKSIITRREKEIIQLIAQEKTADEIASELFLSKHTVEAHKKNLFLKLQVTNMAGLIKKAIYLGYI